jgi:hypothetical protein
MIHGDNKKTFATNACLCGNTPSIMGVMAFGSHYADIHMMV